MKITIQHHGDNFNVLLSSKEGLEPFITIKGARIVSGRNGEFVSWPSRKKDDGTYWNHVYASEAFAAAVLEKAKESAAPPPAAPRRDKMEAYRAGMPAGRVLPPAADDDVPF